MKNTKKTSKNITPQQERFCELVATGLSPKEAFLACGYSNKAVTSNPYKMLARQDIRARIATLIDRHLPRIVKNDIALAKLKVHEGEGVDIPPSLIEAAKQRLYDRSSLGPLIRRVDARSVSVSVVDVTPEDLARYRRALGLPEESPTPQTTD